MDGPTWGSTNSEMKLATYKNSTDPIKWHTKTRQCSRIEKKSNYFLLSHRDESF